MNSQLFMYGTVKGYLLFVVRKTTDIRKTSMDEDYALITVLTETSYNLPTALEPSLISDTGIVNTKLLVKSKDHITPFTISCKHGCCGYIDQVELVYIRPLQGHFSYQDFISQREVSIKDNYELYQTLTSTLNKIQVENTDMDLDIARLSLGEKRLSKHKLEAITNLLQERDNELEKVEKMIRKLEKVSRKFVYEPKILDTLVTYFNDYPRSLSSSM